MLYKKFAVIGDPVSHSLSPLMHRAAFRSASLDYRYSAVVVRPDELDAWVTETGRSMCGFNVTVPHKQAILSQLDAVDDTARKVGAVNTVVQQEGQLLGCNTDVHGFLAALRTQHVLVSKRRAMIFGAGGAARAVAHALCNEGTSVTVINRSATNAQSLALSVGASVDVISLSDSDSIIRVLSESDLIVNATSLGLGANSDRSPVPLDARWPEGSIAVDLVYGLETPFQRQARQAGCRVLDGREMLVQQGAQAIRLWLHIEPDIVAMRAACQSIPEAIR